MNAIRQFESERKAWEAQCEELEKSRRQVEDEKAHLESEKLEAEGRMARLAEEVELLRRAAEASGGPVPTGAKQQSGLAQPSASQRLRHENQLALMSQLDDLRNDLQQAQDSSRSFEKRASEAEQSSEELRAEIDRLRRASSNDLDCTRDVASRSVILRKDPSGASSKGPTRAPPDELLEARRGLEARALQVHRLEESTLRLREELNAEKQKVVDLKKAAHSRGAAWKEELEKIADELGAKQVLEEEVARLRHELTRCREELDHGKERDGLTRREERYRQLEQDLKKKYSEEIAALVQKVEKLQREVEEAREAKYSARKVSSEKMEEMEILSNAVGSQLVAVEQELREQTAKSSQLLELFLQHSHGPLQTLRRSCRRIANSGEAGDEPSTRPVPPIFEPDVHNLQTNLVKIVNLLRFAADVLEAREQRIRQGPVHPVQSDPPQQGIVSQLEDTMEIAKHWLKSGIA